jgi:hypothetical protein
LRAKKRNGPGYCGNQHACFRRALTATPSQTQWRVQQDNFEDDTLNIGKPEHVVCQCRLIL